MITETATSVLFKLNFFRAEQIKYQFLNEQRNAYIGDRKLKAN